MGLKWSSENRRASELRCRAQAARNEPAAFAQEIARRKSATSVLMPSEARSKIWALTSLTTPGIVDQFFSGRGEAGQGETGVTVALGGFDKAELLERTKCPSDP